MSNTATNMPATTTLLTCACGYRGPLFDFQVERLPHVRHIDEIPSTEEILFGSETKCIATPVCRECVPPMKKLTFGWVVKTMEIATRLRDKLSAKKNDGGTTQQKSRKQLQREKRERIQRGLEQPHAKHAPKKVEIAEEPKAQATKPKPKVEERKVTFRPKPEGNGVVCTCNSSSCNMKAIDAEMFAEPIRTGEDLPSEQEIYGFALCHKHAPRGWLPVPSVIEYRRRKVEQEIQREQRRNASRAQARLTVASVPKPKTEEPKKAKPVMPDPDPTTPIVERNALALALKKEAERATKGVDWDSNRRKEAGMIAQKLVAELERSVRSSKAAKIRHDKKAESESQAA